MKRITILFAISVAMIFAACGGFRHEARLMSYNVRNCMGLDGEISYDRVARVINDAAPDAVAVQELDEPDEEAMRVLRERFEVFGKSGGNLTFPADKPEIEIDYICCYKGAGRSCEVADHKVIEAVVESDHRPIVADVRF